MGRGYLANDLGGARTSSRNHMHEADCQECSRVTIIVFARCLLVCPGTGRHDLTSTGIETGVAVHNPVLRGTESIDLIAEQRTLNPRVRCRRSRNQRGPQHHRSPRSMREGHLRPQGRSGRGSSGSTLNWHTLKRGPLVPAVDESDVEVGDG